MDKEPEDDDRLLWELSRLDEAEEEQPIEEDTLRAWREGRLSESEAAEVEARLAMSPLARKRLAPSDDQPRPEVRERVLAGFGRPPVRESHRPVRRWAPVLALAASLLLVAVFALRLRTAGLPEGLAYDVSARGLAAERSTAPETSGVISAYPDTPVRLEVAPRGPAEEGLELGLYRERDGRVERIEPGPSLTVETERGAARFRGLAGDLAGPQPGTRDLYVVVAREGDLPEDRTLGPGEDPRDALAAEGRRLVYIQSIRLLSKTP